MTAHEQRYCESDKMAGIICGNAALLQVMNRFGISLGFGDESVRQVCINQNVDYRTFLAVINFVSQRYTHIEPDAELSVEALLDYLKQSHLYFLDFALPNIRKKLVEAIGESKNGLSGLVMKFFDDYMGEVAKHMEYEEREVFPLVDALLAGKSEIKGRILTFSKYHNPIDEKLRELKNIIIKYYPSEENNKLLVSVLFDIFSCEEELKSHCEIEDYLFVPAVMKLEKGV